MRSLVRRTSSSFAAPIRTCTFQGCRLPPDGARAARSRMLSIVWRATGSGRKARIDLRVASASLTFMMSSDDAGEMTIAARLAQVGAASLSSQQAQDEVFLPSLILSLSKGE